MNEQIRAEFESWWAIAHKWRDDIDVFIKHPHGGYIVTETHDAWVTWQAAHARYAVSAPAQPKVPDIDWLSNVIRKVDGNHKLGAGALAEKIVEAMLSAQENTSPATAVPEGYALVPIEPTEPMVIAGENAWDEQLDIRLEAKSSGAAFATYPSEETHLLPARVAYKAMLTQATKESDK